MWNHNTCPQLVQLLNSSVPPFPPEQGKTTPRVMQGRRPCSTWDKSSQKTFQKVPSETGKAMEKWANEALLETRTWSSWHLAMEKRWEEEAKGNNFCCGSSALVGRHSKRGQLEGKTKAKQQKHTQGVNCQAVVWGRCGWVRHLQNRLQTRDARKG